MKTTQKKLKKVEDRFVEMHKSQKNLIADRETFIQFLQMVFPQNLLEEEILIMPEGAEGYGMFDFNHLRQFWTLTAQTKENDDLALHQTMEEQKKLLVEKIQEYEAKEQQLEQSSASIQQKLNQLLEENDALKEKIAEMSSEDKSAKVNSEIVDQYEKKMEEQEKKMRELQAENSEYKAKQLMNAFQGQGFAGIAGSSGANEGSTGIQGLLEGITSHSGESAEINNLKNQLSDKTNTILQLEEDKEELELKIEELRQLYEEAQENRGSALEEPGSG